MITKTKGDLTTVTKGIIIHQTNCLGIMGKGLALSLSRKWPKVLEPYTKFCYRNGEVLGSAQIVKVAENVYIANIFGQWDYIKRPGAINTQYNAVRSAFSQLVELLKDDVYKDLPIYIANNIGCGLGGGSWPKYLEILKDFDLAVPHSIYLQTITSVVIASWV